MNTLARLTLIPTTPPPPPPEMLNIPEGTRVPSFTVHEVTQALINIKGTTSGPDDLPYCLSVTLGTTWLQS